MTGHRTGRSRRTSDISDGGTVLKVKLLASTCATAALLAACSGAGSAQSGASTGAVPSSSPTPSTAMAGVTPVAAPPGTGTGDTPVITASASGYPTGYPVPPNFFGVHDSTPLGGLGGWPLTPVGSLRVWDAGVSWRQIETAPGKFDFSGLDAIVKSANAHRAETLIVLGQTPSFYATKRLRTDVYGSGAASMPKNLAVWKRYVSLVANRPGIKGNRYVQFQVWNEANVQEFWSGTPAQMAVLTKATREALGKYRYLLAPAFVTRNSFQRTWMDRFYATRVGGQPVANYVNAVSLQLYPLPNGKPEDSMAILAMDQKIMAKYRVNKPVWNTEVNYGLSGPHNVAPLSAPLQAANVSRTYLLNASAGVKRVFWYSWGNTTIANTRTTTANGYSLSAAGKAYAVTRSWLLNSQMRGCTRNYLGTYTCTITYTGGVRRVFWNPTRVVTVAVVGATTDQTVSGATRKYSARTIRMRVGAVPIMIRSAR